MLLRRRLNAHQNNEFSRRRRRPEVNRRMPTCRARRRNSSLYATGLFAGRSLAVELRAVGLNCPLPISLSFCISSHISFTNKPTCSCPWTSHSCVLVIDSERICRRCGTQMSTRQKLFRYVSRASESNDVEEETQDKVGLVLLLSGATNFGFLTPPLQQKTLCK